MARPGSHANLKACKQQLDDATQFIPLWVKVAVAIALGLGTMVGWKCIVVNLPMAWVLTLPAATVLSGSLYGLFARLF